MTAKKTATKTPAKTKTPAASSKPDAVAEHVTELFVIAEAPQQGLPSLMYDRRLEEGERTGAQVLAEYAQLKQGVAFLEARIKQLQNQVIDIITDEGSNKVDDVLGASFSLMMRKTYAYSTQLQRLDDELKAARKLEIAQRIARLQSTAVSVVCKLPKMKG